MQSDLLYNNKRGPQNHICSYPPHSNISTTAKAGHRPKIEDPSTPSPQSAPIYTTCQLTQHPPQRLEHRSSSSSSVWHPDPLQSQHFPSECCECQCWQSGVVQGFWVVGVQLSAVDAWAMSRFCGKGKDSTAQGPGRWNHKINWIFN